MSDEKKVINDEELEKASGGWYPFASAGTDINAQITAMLTDAGNKAWALGDKEFPEINNELWFEINRAEKSVNDPGRHMLIKWALDTAKRWTEYDVSEILPLLQQAYKMAEERMLGQ